MIRTQAKSLFESKTFWFNAATFIIAIIGLLMEQEWIKNNTQIVMYLGMASSIINVIIRSITNQPIKLLGLMLVGLLGFSCLAPVTSYAQTHDSVATENVPTIAVHDSFRKSVISTAQEMVSRGEISRRDMVRIRIAMISPAFREQAKSLAVVELAASGSEALVYDSSGNVDVAAIDWEGLADFLQVFIPLLLELLLKLGVSG
ncbi:MAG: hypothetical protein R3C03_23935 [Pirellulaceae bacterium]